jgi:gamma-glutamylcyclotransferase (GGCT)/AIG2-like uncharacterized protein YtfP
MKMFAYGLNTNISNMANRCPAAKSLGIATLPYHRLMFSYCANVVPALHHNVEGVLWEISKECLRALDNLEGYPHYYGRKNATVLHEGKKVQTMVYYMNGDAQYAPPGDGYLEACYQGYVDHGVRVGQLLEAIKD